MKGLIILVDGFEDTEAITTIDIIKRAGLSLDKVTFNDTLDLVTQCGIKLKADQFYKNISLDEYSFLIIPGGGAVKKTLNKLSAIEKAINHFVKKEQLVACICAAPLLVGKLGLFKDLEYTCFPGCSEGIDGKYKPKKEVIRSKNFITARSMACSVDFSLEIVEYLLGKNKRKEIHDQIYGLI